MCFHYNSSVNNSFQIEIIEHGWLDDTLPEDDICSHGRLRIVIGDQVIIPIANDTDHRPYGISESALALLRTLEGDHSQEQPVAEQLVFHGCGARLMSGCPIGINWRVEHRADYAVISNVVRYDSTNEDDAVHFSGLVVEVPEAQYRQQIVAFAMHAQEPFITVTKVFNDDFDEERYQEFWSEYNALLIRFS